MAAQNAKPEIGDLCIVRNSSGKNVWIIEVGKTGERNSVAHSFTWKGRRRLQIRAKNEEIDAPDCTWRKLAGPLGPWIVAQYLPRYVGRRLFYNLEFVGIVTDENPRKKTASSLPPRETWAFVPGAILVTCWGYDQTNREFFEIVERKRWFVKLQEIGAICQEYRPLAMSGTCLPDPEQRIGEILRRKVRISDGKEQAVKIDDIRNAYLWEGKPASFSTYH